MLGATLLLVLQDSQKRFDDMNTTLFSQGDALSKKYCKPISSHVCEITAACSYQFLKNLHSSCKGKRLQKIF